jgi:Tfp pilus assembly protein PilX
MTFHTQRGVVLVFSLLFLLLLTLATARMISQNQQQFHIAMNQRLQAQELANAENTLILAKQAIDSNYLTQCTNTQLAAPIPNVTNAEILSVSGTGIDCLVTFRVVSGGSDSAQRQLISAYFVNKHRQLSLKEVFEK